MIPFDAPFVPDEADERLDSKGRRDTSRLVVPITDAQGRVIGYEVNF